MSRTRSPAIQKRNDAIYAQWVRGASLTSLAAEYGISRQVVGRLVAERHPEEDEDLERATYRGYLWRLFDEIKDLYDNPGYKLAPTGGPARDPDGNPAEDTNVKLQAGELELKILESLRKLDARDRQAPKQVNVQYSVAQEQMIQDIQRRQQQIVQGEIVRELPPAQPEP